MGEFFGSVYCWFEQFFGLDLANYLWGITSPYAKTNQYIGVGLSMTGITLLVVILYYYIIDKPSFCHWLKWLLFLVANAIVNFIIGWQYVCADLYDSKMVTLDSVTGKEISLPIENFHCLCFGVTNMLLSVLAFVILSVGLKWWSRNCKTSPF